MDFIAETDVIPVLRTGYSPDDAISVVEKLMLDAVDGRRTVAQLGDACGLDVEMACRVAGKLFRAGFLEVKTVVTASVAGSDVADNDKSGGNDSGATPDGEDRIATADQTTQNTTEAAVAKLYDKLESLNYYELLGITPLAQRAEIRAAYFSLSKKYHPDTHFRNGSVELKRKLSYVFDKITVAYETLSGKSKRQAYDESISKDIELWKLEQSLRQSIQPGSTGKSSAGSAEHGKVPDTGATSTKYGNGTSGRVRENRPGERLSQPASGMNYRRTPVQDEVSVGAGARVSRIPITRSSYTAELGGTTPVSEPANSRHSFSTVATSPPRESGNTTDSLSPEERDRRREQWKRDRLRKSLGAGNPPAGATERRSTTGVVAGSEAYLLDHARIAIERHEYDIAVQYVQEILRRDGENAIASQLLRQAQSGKMKSDVNELIRKGRFEQSRGNLAAALELYETAFKLDIRNVDAKFHMALALFESRKDLRKALHICREIVATGGRKPQYFVLLGDLYELMSDSLKAAEMFHRAAELAPEDREIKRRLKPRTKK